MEATHFSQHQECLWDYYNYIFCDRTWSSRKYICMCMLPLVSVCHNFRYSVLMNGCCLCTFLFVTQWSKLYCRSLESVEPTEQDQCDVYGTTDPLTVKSELLLMSCAYCFALYMLYFRLRLIYIPAPGYAKSHRF